MRPLKIIFAGTPAFALPALQALLDSAHEVCAVYTQPDRPAGRGRSVQASPVKQLALGHHIPVLQPHSLKEPSAQQALRELRADLMVVVAYGLLLPAAVLGAPRLGCVNIHASLLPRWRGAAPIQRAILAGDAQTGITLMQMDEGLDTGAILTQRACPISPMDSAATLHDRLAVLGAELLIETLGPLQEGVITPRPQDETEACAGQDAPMSRAQGCAGATYAAKLSKQEAVLDWRDGAVALARKVRAFNPSPVAQATLHCTGREPRTLRIWFAQPLNEMGDAAPGSILRAGRDGVDVATGRGVLRLLEMQLAGGRAITAADFVNAQQLEGCTFG